MTGVYIMLDNRMLDKFFNALNRRDLDQMGTLLTEDAEFHFPKTQPLMGRERILRFFKILFHRYPELLFQVERRIVEGQRAAVHWTNRGVSRKGDPYDNEGVTLFEGGDKSRIIFISDFFKDTEKF
jgi:ketosteroid isomerase-like protein